MLLGTQKYREYFKSAFGKNPCYLSPYVLMEFRRSFIHTIISFYFTLNNPEIKTIGDALTHWSQRYKTSETIAVLQLLGQLIDAHKFNRQDPGDKKKVMKVIGVYVKGLERKIKRQFEHVGADSARCKRAQVLLDIRDYDVTQAFKKFCEDFENVKCCRSQCSIHCFLLKEHLSTVQDYVSNAGSLPRSSHRGFIRITDELDDVLARGASACSCKRCEAIGDAVIALGCPREMVLEHVDASFNDLCKPIHQRHRHLLSETAVLRHRTLPPAPAVQDEGTGGI
jgi:hypothetical protein